MSFYPALARSLGKMAQAVNIMCIAGPKIGLLGARGGVRAACAKGVAAARLL